MTLRSARTATGLTLAQHDVLDVASEHARVRGSNHTCSFRPCISTTVADRLTKRRRLDVVDWDGRASIYKITLPGREALAVWETHLE